MNMEVSSSTTPSLPTNEQIAKESQILLKAAIEVERMVDEEIDRLKSIDPLLDDDLLRERNLNIRKLQYEQTQKHLANGHGSYKEIYDQQDFFDVSKRSRNVVIHFYRPTTVRCSVLDAHLEKLATKYLEVRFTKINAEKAPFLCNKLAIWVLPTLVLFKDKEMVRKMEGFDDLGGDGFTTKQLASYLRKHKLIKPKE